ncbi:coiled-coil domain-containing protein 117 isoform X2 [Conger conger]|uniref:coiled-coil domain-containing protein 117 isoform X2 n=1 Tax=Conger conger TaxID=82655 RepID=UPI002A59F815|nr:coiled-coil domain-containing protein 117 isoform X2 [Conger conger]
MHRPGPVRSELGFLSPVYPISGFGITANQEVSRGGVDAMHFAGESSTSASWERRCLRKHRRSLGDEGSSPKRRRLMGELGPAAWEDPGPKRWPGWAPRGGGGGGGSAPDPAPGLQLGTSPTHSRRCPAPETGPGYPAPAPPPQPRPKPGGLRMEVEAAQRTLQEIEERITLEDDDDDEDLDVEPNRPVLVMSESLRAGLQQGFGDILPQNVAQSMSHSCMELVLWRPPEEALSRRLKDSVEKQRRQASCRQAPQPVGPRPPAPPDTAAPAGLYCTPAAQASTDEEMEL